MKAKTRKPAKAAKPVRVAGKPSTGTPSIGKASGADVIGIGVDDSGLVPGVAETVAELAAMGRVNMTSCVVNAPAWPAASAVLKRLMKSEPQFQCGLHFNLTEGAPLSAELTRVWPALPRLEHLLVLAHLKRLPLAAIAAEWRAQGAAFRAAMGTAPAFIDGHQHVHGLPGVREAVLDDVRTWPHPPAVRNTGHLLGPGHAFKRVVIEGTGGRGLQRLLMQHALPHNAAMVGVYGFETTDYGAMVRRWLAAAPREGALLMCHPLLSSRAVDDGAGGRRMPRADNSSADTTVRNDTVPNDPIATARRTEALYLASPRFAEDLAAAGFTVGVPWVTRTTSAG